MSISPIRANSPPQSPGLFSDRHAPTSKKQMFWDPSLGFVTKEQREKMIREADLKLRESQSINQSINQCHVNYSDCLFFFPSVFFFLSEEGRPLPTNEAEKILEILETGRPSNSLWGSRRANNVSVFVFFFYRQTGSVTDGSCFHSFLPFLYPLLHRLRVNELAWSNISIDPMLSEELT
jgi:hypothetical protein